MDLSRRLRNLANVVNLSTPLGLVLGRLGGGAFQRHGSLLVAEKVRLPLLNASAVTVGDVVLVLGRTLPEAEHGIPRLMEHEEEHAWQWAYCLGLPFIGFYVVAMAWSTLRHGDRATGNVFERQAGLASGGYVSRAADAPSARPGAGSAGDATA